jgi:Na+-transporting methylmalonyl-CoA/oxaloacetate decarboxylase gamma subunit
MSDTLFKGTKEDFIMEMDNVTFGVTMLVAGMGGTLVTLGLLSLMMTALGKLFPYKEESGKEG